MSTQKNQPAAHASSQSASLTEPLGAAAQDALTDEMVGRLAASVGQSLTLLDQANRAGLEHLLPIIAQMASNGDLERIAQLARLVGSAQDALSDEMVGRMAETFGSGLTLLDQANRAGLDRALPIIAQMADNGDLERIAQMARLVGSAQDALTDEMVVRLAELLNRVMNLLDNVCRSSVAQTISALERMNSSGLLDRMAQIAPALERLFARLTPESVEKLTTALDAAAKAPPAKGGLGGFLEIARRPDTQDALLLLTAITGPYRNRQG